MKYPKCPKTITGKHYFQDQSYDMVVPEFPEAGIKTKKYRIKKDIICVYCGIIDDRKEKGGL
jgi:hypothetical protein